MVYALAASLALSLAPPLPQQDAGTADSVTRLLRFPDVHGDTVVFCHAGDLWRASTSGGDAVRLTAHPGLELFPRISPDGTRVAFTAQIDGDEQVFVMPIGGGVPRQLTHYPTPGPLPERWGYDHQVLDWTPDGRGILFRSTRESYAISGPRLFVVPAEGGLPTALAVPSGGSGCFSPDGRRLVYSPLFRDFRAWKRYQGGWAQDLWIFDPETGQARNITDHPRTDRDPMWIGDRIYFASDRSGTLNLYRCDPASGDIEQETLSEHWDVRWPAAGGPNDHAIVFEQAGHLVLFDTETRDQKPLAIRVPDDGLARRPERLDVSNDVHDAGLSPSGRRMVAAAHGDIFSIPVEHGPARNLTRSPGAHDRLPAWSPDGAQIAFVSDAGGEEQIWVVPQTGGEARQVTRNLEVRLHDPIWSPSGERIAFCDKDGVLRVVEVATGELRTVADESRGTIEDATWSPWEGDAYLAFSMTTASGFSAIHVWDRESGQLHVISPQTGDDHSPSWSPDGERLFFLGARSWSPRVGDLEWDYSLDRRFSAFAVTLRQDLGRLLPPRSDEVEIADETPDGESDEEAEGGDAPGPIRFEGIRERLEHIPLPFANWAVCAAVDGGLLAARRGGFYYGRGSDAPPTLVRFDFDSRETEDMAEGIGGLSLSHDRKHVLVRRGGGYERMPTSGGNGTSISTAGLAVDRVPHEEWAQIFDEVWRRFRDYFYVANMHGHDWAALRRQYRELLPHVHHRADLNYLISEMIGELNVGHAYITGGLWEQEERPRAALPGALFELDREAGRYRIRAILRGDNSDPKYRSPLTALGVNANVGDYVLAIDGEPLEADDNPYRLLRHKGAHPVTLTLAKRADGAETRDVAFEAVANESDLHYHEWVSGRRAAVAAQSGGRLGYLHVPDMGDQGLREFIKWFYPQRHLEGIVIDVRGNGGGNVSQMLIERLSRKPLMGTFGRTSGYRVYPQATFEGRLICLLDEDSASDGDIFPAMFRRSGLGKLVGKRSWGGIIGITNRGNLIDGGVVNVPEFGNTELDGEWTIEGTGVEPDIEVDNGVDALLAGRDPQLERAVQELLAELETNPRPRRQAPPDPVRNGR